MPNFSTEHLTLYIILLYIDCSFILTFDYDEVIFERFYDSLQAGIASLLSKNSFYQAMLKTYVAVMLP